MGLARATLQVIRPYSSLLAFLSILVPVLARTNDLSLSLRRAIPLLFVSMCTFIINDLYDVEKDKINHPERPLPSGQVKPAFVAVLYYICLASSLIATRFCVDVGSASFLYYLLLSMCISYNCVVDYLPGIKPIYVAATSLIPVLILIAYYPGEESLHKVAAAVFFFMLGRELCKDLLDRRGDPVSFLHAIAASKVASLAFAAQGVGLVVLALNIKGFVASLDLILMMIVFGLSYVFWFRLGRLNAATILMKVVIYLGLYFLI